jgi:hypothetical protein
LVVSESYRENGRLSQHDAVLGNSWTWKTFGFSPTHRWRT